MLSRSSARIPLLRGLVIGAATVLAITVGGTASACSRAFIESPRAALERAEGAFVGVLIGERSSGDRNAGSAYTFLVEWSLKGEIDRTVTVVSGTQSDCGLWVDLGDRSTKKGIVLSRESGKWMAQSGDVFDADALRAAAADAHHLGSVGTWDRFISRTKGMRPTPANVVSALFFVAFTVLFFRAARSRLKPRKVSNPPP